MTFKTDLGGKNWYTIPYPNTSLNFTAPTDIYRINFEITGIKVDNEKVMMSTESYYRFYTPKEYEEKHQTYIAYLLALLGLVLIYVPVMIVNIENYGTKSNYPLIFWRFNC